MGREKTIIEGMIDIVSTRYTEGIDSLHKVDLDNK